MTRALAIVLSLAVHGLLLSGWIRADHASSSPVRAEPCITFGSAFVDRANAATKKPRLFAQRSSLVQEARASFRRRTLRLGDFLVRANAIDADEQDRSIDETKVRKLYDERLSSARAALLRGDVRAAVPEVFADLRYFGRPGGLMADALADRGGSCEPISVLIAATLHDLGRGADVVLRYYGGADETGASHLAPIARTQDGEFDLMSGKPAHPHGTSFPPEELVEAYARTHGVADSLAHGRGASTGKTTGAEADAAAPKTNELPTMAGGFPPNGDRFPGSVPLYAARAVAPQSVEAGSLQEVDAADTARDCAFTVRMAVLDPPKLGTAGGSDVEVRRTPRPSELERKSSWLRGVEEFMARPGSDEADKLMSLSCLSALGETTAVDLTLAGEYALANIAQARSKAAREAGNRLISSIRWSSSQGSAIRSRLSERYQGRTWILLALDGGADLVFDLLTVKKAEDWGHVNALAALTVSPRTRSRALEVLAELPRRDQVDVMHEVFLAHDHQRPWSSNYELSPDRWETEGEFRRAYRVFRGLAWRLWDGERPIDETLARFDAEAEARKLDPEWRAHLLQYYARNLLGLASHREGGLASVRALRVELGRRRHPIHEQLVHRLDEIDAKGVLDGVTLSDAWRLR